MNIKEYWRIAALAVCTASGFVMLIFLLLGGLSLVTLAVALGFGLLLLPPAVVVAEREWFARLCWVVVSVMLITVGFRVLSHEPAIALQIGTAMFMTAVYVGLFALVRWKLEQEANQQTT